MQAALQNDLFGEPTPERCFETDAMGFLIAFAKKHRGEAFSSEDVTLAAQSAGIAPVTDLRAWGHIFQQAAKDGYIRRSDRLFARSLGNGSLAPGWVGI